MRPVHRRAQRLLAAHRGARAAGQQPEPVVQAVDDLGQRQRPHPRGGELDGQRHAVEAPADLGCTTSMLSSVTRKSGRTRRARSANKSIGLVVSDSDGTCQTHFAGDADRLTTGGQQRQPRAGAQQHGDAARRSPSSRCSQLSSTTSRSDGRRVNRSSVSMVERPAGRAGPAREPTVTATTSGMGDRRQVDVPDAVGEFVGQSAATCTRQPGLAHAARRRSG